MELFKMSPRTTCSSPTRRSSVDTRRESCNSMGTRRSSHTRRSSVDSRRPTCNSMDTRRSRSTRRSTGSSMGRQTTRSNNTSVNSAETGPCKRWRCKECGGGERGLSKRVTWCENCRPKVEGFWRNRQEQFDRVYDEVAEDLAKLSKFLLECGCPPYVNAKITGHAGERFTYPLHMAVLDDDEDMVRMLIRCGANTTLRDSSGKTAKELEAEVNTIEPLKPARRDGRFHTGVSSVQSSVQSAFSAFKRTFSHW
mmetsp:Transcript_155487/g.270450  ORF Transcript_155487/g.270450 Transcript_155487/m.270450 type:complete len:253 (-) Transcript_155487:79-837(-)